MRSRQVTSKTFPCNTKQFYKFYSFKFTAKKGKNKVAQVREQPSVRICSRQVEKNYTSIFITYMHSHLLVEIFFIIIVFLEMLKTQCWKLVSSSSAREVSKRAKIIEKKNSFWKTHANKILDYTALTMKKFHLHITVNLHLLCELFLIKMNNSVVEIHNACFLN